MNRLIEQKGTEPAICERIFGRALELIPLGLFQSG
jgi:hypothetical protein